MKRVTHYDQVGFIPEMPGFFNIWKSVWYISLHQIEQNTIIRCRKSFWQKSINIIKTIYDKPISNIIFNGEKLKAFPLKSGTRQGCPLSPLLFKIVLEILVLEIRKKRNPSWKRSKTVTICRWCDTIHAAAKSLQSCPTVCDPIDGSPPGFPSLGFSRQEHWSGLPFPSPMHESEKWKWSRSSRARPSATPWTAAYQAPPSTGFSRQEYWSGVPLPSPILYIENPKDATRLLNFTH